MIKRNNKNLYSGSNSRGLILYSKKDGMGYRSPFGDDDEGSDIFLSTMGCLPLTGIVGLAVLIICEEDVLTATVLIFCMEDV